MDFKEAMKKRHVVRRYRDEELDSETVSALKNASKKTTRNIRYTSNWKRRILQH